MPQPIPKRPQFYLSNGRPAPELPITRPDNSPQIGGHQDENSPMFPRLVAQRRQMTDAPSCATCDNPSSDYRYHFTYLPDYGFCPRCAARIDIFNGDLVQALGDNETTQALTEWAVVHRAIFGEWYDLPPLQGLTAAAVGRLNAAGRELKNELLAALPEWIQRLRRRGDGSIPG